MKRGDVPESWWGRGEDWCEGREGVVTESSKGARGKGLTKIYFFQLPCNTELSFCLVAFKIL